MSQILDKLRLAEAERQRIVAERKRLEAEADAALAAREMEERAGRAPAVVRADAPARERRKIERRTRASPPAGSRTRLAVGAALALCLAAGVALFRQEPKPVPQRAFELKLDRDLESFAQRLAEKEKR